MVLNLIDSHPSVFVALVGFSPSIIGLANGIPGEGSVWETILQQGGATAVALFAIGVIKLLHSERVKDMKEQAERRREDAALTQQILADALKANSATAAALSALTEQIRGFRVRE